MEKAEAKSALRGRLLKGCERTGRGEEQQMRK